MNIHPIIRLLILMSCIGLAACAAGPDYAPPDLAAPPAWSRLATGDAPMFEGADPGDLSRWWERFGDPLLSDLAAEALRENQDLHAARARLRQARARAGAASADFFPDLNASASGRTSRSSKETGGGGTREFYSAGLDASWELDVFGGVRRSVEAARADLAAAAAGLRDVQVSLMAEVAMNYVQVRSLQTRIDIARDNLKSQAETLQLTTWRAQAGLVGAQDVEQARANLEQTRARMPSLQISLAEAEHSLDILLGKPPGTLRPRLAGGGDLPTPPERVAVGIPADVLRQRPDVRAAERTLAGETARVGVAEAARYPAFRLSGSIGLEALTIGALGNSGAGASSLLAGVSAPLFNAGRLRRQVEIQDAAREQALAGYRQAVLDALRDVENALVALARNQERAMSLKRAAEAAGKAAAMARQRYAAGLIDFQPVLDTDRTELSVEDNLAGARADGALALIQLYKALGGGWRPRAETRPAGEDMP